MHMTVNHRSPRPRPHFAHFSGWPLRVSTEPLEKKKIKKNSSSEPLARRDESWRILSLTSRGSHPRRRWSLFCRSQTSKSPLQVFVWDLCLRGSAHFCCFFCISASFRASFRLTRAQWCRHQCRDKVALLINNRLHEFDVGEVCTMLKMLSAECAKDKWGRLPPYLKSAVIKVSVLTQWSM
jgi:hypothetical protein